MQFFTEKSQNPWTKCYFQIKFGDQGMDLNSAFIFLQIDSRLYDNEQLNPKSILQSQDVKSLSNKVSVRIKRKLFMQALRMSGSKSFDNNHQGDFFLSDGSDILSQTFNDKLDSPIQEFKSLQIISPQQSNYLQSINSQKVILRSDRFVFILFRNIELIQDETKMLESKDYIIQHPILSRILQENIIECRYCLILDPQNTLINPCQCEQQWHPMCLKQLIIEQKKNALFDQSNFTCEVCTFTYKILRIEYTSIKLLKYKINLSIKMIILLIFIVGVFTGLTAFLINLSLQEENEIGLIVFSLMILFFIAMCLSAYLVLELIRLATQVSWTVVDRSHESPNLMQFGFLNMFLENGIIHMTNKIVPVE